MYFPCLVIDQLKQSIALVGVNIESNMRSKDKETLLMLVILRYSFIYFLGAHVVDYSGFDIQLVLLFEYFNRKNLVNQQF